MLSLKLGNWVPQIHFSNKILIKSYRFNTIVLLVGILYPTNANASIITRGKGKLMRISRLHAAVIRAYMFNAVVQSPVGWRNKYTTWYILVISCVLWMYYNHAIAFNWKGLYIYYSSSCLKYYAAVLDN